MPLGKKIARAPQFTQALQSAVLGLGLSVSPAQLSAIQEKVAAAFEQTEKNTNLQEALDTFGKENSVQASAQNPNETPEPAQAGGGQRPTAQPDKTKPEGSPEKTTPPETPTQPKPTEQPPGAADSEPSTEEKKNPAEESPTADEQTPERSGATQAVNAFRYRKELKEADAQLDALGKEKKKAASAGKKAKKELAPFAIRKKYAENTLRLLKILRWLLWAVGGILSLFGVGEILITWAVYLGRDIKRHKRNLLILKKRMAPVEAKVKSADEKVKKIDRDARAVAQRAMRLRNASLLRRRQPGGPQTPEPSSIG